MTTRLGKGVYTIFEMAGLTRIPHGRVRSWVSFGSGSVGLVVPETHHDGEVPSFSFLDLIEILVAGQLRERKISMQSVRLVHAAMKEMFGSEHPFAHERLLTQGRRVFQQFTLFHGSPSPAIAASNVSHSNPVLPHGGQGQED